MPRPLQPFTAWVDLVDLLDWVDRVDWVNAANPGLVDCGFHRAA